MKFLMLIFGGIIILNSSCDIKRSINIKHVQNKIGEAFLIGFEKIELYDTINGNKIVEIQNNESEELYYFFDIYEQQGNWFKVQKKSIEGDSVFGWIFNKSYLGTYPRNYNENLSVYFKPNKKSTIVCSVSYFTFPMEIIEIKNNWIKVRINDKDVSCKGGWVMSDMTCSNPYTTCN